MRAHHIPRSPRKLQWLRPTATSAALQEQLARSSEVTSQFA